MFNTNIAGGVDRFATGPSLCHENIISIISDTDVLISLLMCDIKWKYNI